MRLEKMAHLLYEAYQTKEGIEPLSKLDVSLSPEEAYQVQLINVRQWQNQGDKITGKKIGLTSLPMQEMFNVNEPDYGIIFASKEKKNHSIILKNEYLLPRVEAEIAFVMKKDLITNHLITYDQVKDAIDYAIACFEIVDSRIKNWDIKLVDTIADSASFAGYVIGDIKIPLDKIDLINEEMHLFQNDQLVGHGQGKAVLDDPINCVTWLANKLNKFNVYLNKGDIVLSGALSKAIDVNAGDTFKAVYSNLGSIEVSFK
ncbi:MAG: fumarylacetoacetate hydrolase family protein [Bacilli bacterium]|jgi:2-keto-4-pentenoate hydratase|nr:fumarylacetoacetate hydrolase family protein [Bacilli bacterium]